MTPYYDEGGITIYPVNWRDRVLVVPGWLLGFCVPCNYACVPTRVTFAKPARESDDYWRICSHFRGRARA